MFNYIVKLRPYFHRTLWGWEKWNISTHKNGSSIIENGNYQGQLLSDFVRIPIIIKIIFAEMDLSVQVHPNEEYASQFENDDEKNECWYFIEVKDGVDVVLGLKNVKSGEHLREILSSNAIEGHLNKISIKSGDFISVPAGTVHSICSGVKVLEVQQASDTTYRLYDWNRGRETHIDKAIGAAKYDVDITSLYQEVFENHTNEYYSVEKIQVNEEYCCEPDDKMTFYTVTDGSLKVQSNDAMFNDYIAVKDDESFIVPEGMSCTVTGNGTIIKVRI